MWKLTVCGKIQDKFRTFVFLEFLSDYIAEEFLENVFDLLQIFSLTDLFLIINPNIYIRECS